MPLQRIVLTVLMFPGLGVFYIALWLAGEMDIFPGLPGGELVALTPGKSLANWLEVPFAFAIGAFGTKLVGDEFERAPHASGRRLAQAFGGCYLFAIAMYFVMPVIPE